jgi:hypothetical protein
MVNQQVNWDDVHRQNYESRAFWDIHWIRMAKNLLLSAELIEPEVLRYWESLRARAKDKAAQRQPDRYLGPYFMLMAYAMENLLKAAIVRVNSSEYKQAFRAKRKFPAALKGHDLMDLARKAGLKVNLDEEDLLRRLTRSAVWFGRYPVPLYYRDNAGAETFSDGKKYSVSYFRGDDIERLHSFVQHISTHLRIRV